MLHRRSPAIAAGMLLLLAPVLSSCGFNYATDRVNTISTGINDREGEVDVLGAAIVANQDNTGLFVGSLANNSITEPDTLTAVGGDVTATDFAAVEVPAANDVSLYTEGGLVPITGEFKAGDFVSVDLTFESGQQTTVNVVVVKPCFQYAPDAFDPPLALGEPAEVETETAETDEAAEPDLYSCAAEVPDEHAEGTEGEQ